MRGGEEGARRDEARVPRWGKLCRQHFWPTRGLAQTTFPSNPPCALCILPLSTSASLELRYDDHFGLILISPVYFVTTHSHDPLRPFSLFIFGHPIRRLSFPPRACDRSSAPRRNCPALRTLFQEGIFFSRATYLLPFLFHKLDKSTRFHSACLVASIPPPQIRPHPREYHPHSSHPPHPAPIEKWPTLPRVNMCP